MSFQEYFILENVLSMINKMESSLINFKRVNMPGNYSFQLKGSILLVKKETWVSSISYYVPVEILEISKFKKRDLRRLWEGILGLMIAFLIFLPLSLWKPYNSLFVRADLIWFIPLTVLFAISLIIGIRGIILFLPSRPAVKFSIIHGVRSEMFSFWVKPGTRQKIEELIEQILRIKNFLNKSNEVPLRICPAWYRSRPYRKAIVVGMAISFVLFCLITLFIVVQTLLGGVGKFWLLFLILPFPPIFSVLSEFIGRNGFTSSDIRKFRSAYENERLEELAGDLQNFLKNNPDLYPARFFYIQVLTELGDFEQALKQCELLHELDPSVANKIKMVILEFKKVKDRMNFCIDPYVDTYKDIE